GAGFEFPGDGRSPLLCGGGVGAAPLAALQDRLGVARARLGCRDGAHAPGAALLRDVRVATDDGSVGHHGFVTGLLAAELDAGDDVVVYACGPPPMLEAVRALCAARGVPAQLALESGMACGFGACFGCVVPTREGYVRLCVDGPVLDADVLETVARMRTTASVPCGSHECGRRHPCRWGRVNFCAIELDHPIVNGPGPFDAIAA